MRQVTAGTPLLREKKKKRAWELDFLRGIAVIAMCFDHLMWDFAFGFNARSSARWFSNIKEVNNSFINAIQEFALTYWRSGYNSNAGFRFWAHYLFVFLFLFMVGTSCAFSRDNARRGSKLFLLAFAFTGATMILRKIGIMDQGVFFGILDCIALSILCAASLDSLTKWNKHVNLYAPLVIGTLICLLGVCGKFWLMEGNFDRTFNSDHILGYMLGANAYGDDWFGLFPYVGAVLMGMYWGKAAYPTRQSLLPRLDGKWNKPFTFVGRHALIFYVLHQALLSGLVLLLGLCLGYKAAF